MATRTSPYSTRFKIVAAVVVGIAGVLFYLAFTSLGDDEDPVLSAGDSQVVENLIPRRNAQVPQQSSVGIDLVVGWSGRNRNRTNVLG